MQGPGDTAMPGTGPSSAPETSFVFISYSRADGDFVERLVADLEAHGVACWVDRQGLPPGTADWEQAVREAIRACRAVLLVASPDSRRSRFVKAELEVAELHGRPILPLWAVGEAWIESVPLFLGTAQFADARGERYPKGLSEIAAALHAVPLAPSGGASLGREATVATTLAEAPRHNLQASPGLRGLEREQLPATAPSDRTAPSPPYGTLPILPTAVLGRETEVAAAAALLRREDVRLLTVIGPGGIGKTRLAIQVAHTLQEHFTDGVYFVSLAPLGDPGLVLETIARALGLTSPGTTALAPMLIAFLRGMRLLLVLDNFEHLTGAAPDIAALLARCGKLQVLATSRAALRIQGERLFALTPLALPEDAEGGSPETIAQSPAVALFVQRAQSVKPDFALTTENAATVANICRRLDGLPLALELSAARIKLLSPRALLARLEQRLHVLTGGARDLPERHQTMRATIAWSYELLEESGRTLFRRLAAFAGGCTLDAVEAVCYGPDDREGAALEELESLLDRSLLRAVEQADGEPRFQMLETIREYGLECLEVSGEAEATRRSHAEHFLAQAEAAEPELWGAEQATWLARLEADLDNLRAALRWAVEVGELDLGLRLAGALWRFWRVRGRSHEGLAVLGELLARQRASRGTDRPATVRAKALSGAGALAAHAGDFVQATTLLEESVALHRALGDRPGLAGALVDLGSAMYWQGQHERAIVLMEEGLALYRDLGDRRRLPEALHYLGMMMLTQGSLERATALIEESVVVCKEEEDTAGQRLAISYLAAVARAQGNLGRAMTLEEEGLALARELGDIVGIAQQLNNLGRVAILRGDLERARASYAEGLALPWDKRNLWGVAFYLEGVAGVAAGLGQAAQAARLLGVAEALHEAVNAPAPPSEREFLEHTVASIREALDEETLDAAWAAGRTLPVEQAIATARELVQPGVRLLGERASSVC